MLFNDTQDWFPTSLASEPTKESYKSANKTDEEIKKLMLNEGLDEVQKSMLILSKGQNLQKHSVYKGLCRICLDATNSKELLALICDRIRDEDQELQIECALNLAKLLPSKNLEKSQLVSLFRTTMSIINSSSQQVQISWVVVLSSLLSVLNYDSVERELETCVLLLSEKSQSINNKITAARLLGVIAEKTRHLFPNILYDRVRSLCHDSETEVRHVMSQEILEKLCKNIKTDLLDPLLDKIVELIYDSELNVKLSAIRLLLMSLDLFSEDTRKTRLSHICLEFFCSLNDEVVKVISYFTTKVIHDLDIYFRDNTPSLSNLIASYKDHSSHKSEEVRVNWVLNLPSILTIPMLTSKMIDSFKIVYLSFLNEGEENVRKTAIEVLPNMIKILGQDESIKLFSKPIKALLSDSDPLLSFFLPLLSPILLHLSEPHSNNDLERPLSSSLLPPPSNPNSSLLPPSSIRSLLSVPSIPQPPIPCYFLQSSSLPPLSLSLPSLSSFSSFFDEVLKIICGLIDRLEKTNKWRTIGNILKILGDEEVLACFDCGELNERYFAMLLTMMKSAICETRQLAARNLSSFLRSNPNSKKRGEINKIVYENFFKAKNFQRRLLYLDFCSNCLEYVSFSFMKMFILPDVLELCTDKVPNVRLKATNLMLELRNCLGVELPLSEEEEGLEKWRQTLSRLCEDKDPDVRLRASLIKNEIQNKNYGCVETSKWLEKMKKERMMEEERLDSIEKKELEELKRKKLETFETSLKLDSKPKIKLITTKLPAIKGKISSKIPIPINKPKSKTELPRKSFLSSSLDIDNLKDKSEVKGKKKGV